MTNIKLYIILVIYFFILIFNNNHLILSYENIENDDNEIQYNSPSYYKIKWNNHHNNIDCNITSPSSCFNNYKISKLNNNQNNTNEIEINQLKIKKNELLKFKNYIYKNESNTCLIYGYLTKKTISSTLSMLNLEIIKVYKLLPLLVNNNNYNNNNEKSNLPNKYYKFKEFSNLNCKPSSPLEIKPCFKIISNLLNFNSNFYFINKIIYPSVVEYFDNNWLNFKTFDIGNGGEEDDDDNRLIAFGKINNKFEFIISSIYINLNDPNPNCLITPNIDNQCNSNQIVTFDRDKNRCLVNQSCTTIAHPNELPIFPTCPNGYSLSFFPSKDGGDFKFFCDASFLTETY